MALTKKDLQEVIGKAEERLGKRIDASEERLRKEIQQESRVVVTALRNEFKAQLGKTNEHLDKLTELATDTLEAVSTLADNVPSLEEHKELKEGLDEIDQRTLQ